MWIRHKNQYIQVNIYINGLVVSNLHAQRSADCENTKLSEAIHDACVEAKAIYTTCLNLELHLLPIGQMWTVLENNAKKSKDSTIL